LDAPAVDRLDLGRMYVETVLSADEMTGALPEPGGGWRNQLGQALKFAEPCSHISAEYTQNRMD